MALSPTECNLHDEQQLTSPVQNHLHDEKQPSPPMECNVDEVNLLDDSIVIDPAAPSHSDTDKAVTEFGTIFLYDKIVEEASIHNPMLVSTYKCDCQLVGHNQHVPLRSLYKETPVIRGGGECGVVR